MKAQSLVRRQSRMLVLSLFAPSALAVFSGCASDSDGLRANDSHVLSLGYVQEYEVSNDDSHLAVLTAAEAKAPGSSDFASAFESGIIDDWQILVYELEDSNLVRESPKYGDMNFNVANLRWFDNGTLLFLLKMSIRTRLVSWDVVTDEREEYDFPYTNFDLSTDRTQLIAWDNTGERHATNELIFLEWPSLQEVRILTLDEIDQIEEAQWVGGDSWIRVFDLLKQRVFKLSPASGEMDLLLTTPRLTHTTPVDPRGNLLVALQAVSLSIYNLNQQCVVETDETIFYGPEWSSEQPLLYLLQTDSRENQTLFLKRDMRHLYEPTQECLSEASG